MLDRFSPRALLVIGLALPIAGCTSSALVDSIVVAPTTASIAAGQTVQFTATGSVGHGSHPATTEDVTTQVTWTSGLPAVATINSSGVATAVSPGTTTITATMNGYTGLISATSSLTVTASGQGGGVNPTGSDVVTLTITPGSQTVASPGDTATFTVTGATASGANVNLNDLVVWSSSSTQIATINVASGVVTAVGQGTTTISAQYTNTDLTVATGTATFTVTGSGSSNNDITSVTVTPSSQTVATVGDTAAFTATGTMASGATKTLTTLVTWSASSPQIATIAASGVATAVGQGTTTITAQYTNTADQTVATGTATFTVTGGGTTNSDVTSIAIIPSTQSVAGPGGIAQFIPIGTTSAGATINLSGSAQLVWSSSSTQIATVTQTGAATAVSQGTATISAVYTNADKTSATGAATFQVLAGAANQVTALTIFPGAQAATSLGQQSQFTVLGTEGGVQHDLTTQVVWSSSMSSVATVGTQGNGTPGLVTATAVGSTTIEATYTNSAADGGGEVYATASYSVTAGTSPEPLLSINVVPSGTTVSSQGMTGQYLAFGTYSTPPLMRDITDEVTWISLLPNVASVGSGGTSGELAGLATAEGYTGNTVIYAEDTKTNPDHTVVLSNSQTFTCKDPITQVCDPEIAVPQFATLTVFVDSENTFVPNLQQIGPDDLPYGEYVTAPSDTNTPNLIHCDSSVSSPYGSSGATSQWGLVGGTGGVVCTGTYEVDSTVTLTENLPLNSTYFGGWSSGAAETLECEIQTGGTTSNSCGFNNPAAPPAGWFCNSVTTGTGATATTTSTCYDPIQCTPAAGYTNANSQTCTLPLLADATVGVIFY